jgi:hypothetical protein
MPEIIADPPVLPCYSPVPRSGITEYQWLDPDPFASRAGARVAPRSSRPGMRASLFVAKISLLDTKMSLLSRCYLAVFPLLFRCYPAVKCLAKWQISPHFQPFRGRSGNSKKIGAAAARHAARFGRPLT